MCFMRLCSVSLRYLKNTLKKNELDAWDRPEENCRKNEWCVRCRAQGVIHLYNHYNHVFVY